MRTEQAATGPGPATGPLTTAFLDVLAAHARAVPWPMRRSPR
ncbi:hypothetical protein [Streptomyces olivoreticuli]|nr:hypothetical protein [Streptomyces olivoreticuli]